MSINPQWLLTLNPLLSASLTEVLWHAEVLVASGHWSFPALPTLARGALWPVPVSILFLSPLKQYFSYFSPKMKWAAEDDDQASGHEQKTKQDERCCCMQRGCISVDICKDLCGTDSMHLNTRQYHPLYITVQLSNYYNKLKCLFSLFFSYLTEREI